MHSRLVTSNLVSYVIEKNLINSSPDLYNFVLEKLHKDYYSDIRQCYTRPELLQKILQEIDGSSDKVIFSIKSDLLQFSDSSDIVDYMKKLT